MGKREKRENFGVAWFFERLQNIRDNNSLGIVLLGCIIQNDVTAFLEKVWYGLHTVAK